MNLGDFTVWGPSHIAALVLFLTGCLWLARYGPHFTPRHEKIFAIAICSFTIPLQLWQFTPGDWQLSSSLPLQICDWSWPVAAAALLTRNRLLCSMTFLWGVVLTTQAMLAPDLHNNFPHPRYVMFWGMHILVVWAAVYMAVGRKIIPTWKEYWLTICFTLAWLATALIFNKLAHTNYGYVNGKPPGGSILDYLGPWPLYVLWEILLVALVWALMVSSMRFFSRRRSAALA